jgi:glycosyltransferase involved in cell wall biosynthesis
MKKRVAINGIPLNNPLTGVARFTSELTLSLLELNEFDIYIFDGRKFKKNLMNQENKAPNFVSKSKRYIRSYLPFSYQFLRCVRTFFLRKLIKKHKIELFIETSIISFDIDIPVISVVHDLSWIYYPESHPKERVKNLNRYIKKTIDTSYWIVTDSDSVKNEVTSMFKRKTNIVSIPLGVNQSNFYPRTKKNTKNVIERLNLQYKEYFLSVATLEPRKNILNVIKAYNNLADDIKNKYCLVIIGMKGWGDDLEKLIDVNHNIKILKYIPDADLPYYFCGAKIFIYASYYEGFGLPILESMSCGTPVINSNVSSMPEVSGNSSLLINPKNCKQISQSLTKLINSKTLYKRLTLSGRTHSKKFTWRKTAEKYASIIRSI